MSRTRSSTEKLKSVNGRHECRRRRTSARLQREPSLAAVNEPYQQERERPRRRELQLRRSAALVDALWPCSADCRRSRGTPRSGVAPAKAPSVKRTPMSVVEAALDRRGARSGRWARRRYCVPSSSTTRRTSESSRRTLIGRMSRSRRRACPGQDRGTRPARGARRSPGPPEALPGRHWRRSNEGDDVGERVVRRRDPGAAGARASRDHAGGRCRPAGPRSRASRVRAARARATGGRARRIRAPAARTTSSGCTRIEWDRRGGRRRDDADRRRARSRRACAIAASRAVVLGRARAAPSRSPRAAHMRSSARCTASRTSGLVGLLGSSSDSRGR